MSNFVVVQKIKGIRISESRLVQSGQKRLISGEMILFSGHEEDAPHTEGVALTLSRSAPKALMEWESHGPRVIRAVFRTKQKKIKLNIVQQCYVPIKTVTKRISVSSTTDSRV